MKLVGRGDTTVVDAYLSPILRRYVDEVAAEMPGVELYFMQSSGGLAEASAFQGKDAILSGPAGGIVGMVRTAELGLTELDAGSMRVIGFDMGGTSTDVSHFAGEFERAFETRVAGVRVRAPMMAIHTVAAGGGSILGFDGARFRVGPESAGANPGPACYRRGGPLTVTDANVALGKIQPEFFPRVFGPHGDEALDAGIVAERFAALADEIAAATGKALAPEAVAAGFVDIAVGSMANAIKKISVARGYDVTRYTLQCFGGAGGQHACLVADALGMERVFIHPLAGVLSAYGMGLADQAVLRQEALELPLAGAHASVAARLDALAAQAAAELARQGVAQARISVHRRVHLRYEGTDSALVVPFADARRLAGCVRVRVPAALRVPDARTAFDRRGGVGRGGRRRRCRRRDAPRARRRRRAGRKDGAHVSRRALAGRCARRACERAPGADRLRAGDRRREQRDDDRRAGLDRPHHRARPSRPRAHDGAAGAPRRRHLGRPGPARGVQQPVHEHRRADGAAAAEHGLLGQHQGAARLLVRAVRRRRQPDRQRAAHAGPPRLDERVDQDRDRKERRAHEARRRVRAQRSVPRRHAPARRDGGHARLPRPKLALSPRGRGSGRRAP